MLVFEFCCVHMLGLGNKAILTLFSAPFYCQHEVYLDNHH